MARIIIVILAIAISSAHSAIVWQGNWALGCDFRGNDLKDELTFGENCGTRCSQTTGCTHFTWTDHNDGTCWMKYGPVSKSDAVENADRSAVCGIMEGAPAPGVWRTADLTNYESYPDPNSEECIVYNGCTWAGYFAFVNGKQTESWVRANNIIAVHSNDAQTYRLKTLRLRQGTKQIDAIVYDMCADSDCNGCCTANMKNTGFLIDIEKFTMERFGSGSGIVEWQCLNC